MVSNTPYTFHETFTYTDICLTYCILCNKCGKLYIHTHFQQSVRFRVHQHASKTKKLVRLVYQDFARKLHNFHRDHRIIPLEHCEPDALQEQEAYWIRTLQTLIPHGLNSAYGKPYTLMTVLPLSVSPPQVLFPPPHNHSETTYKIQTTLHHPHLFIFVKAGF